MRFHRSRLWILGRRLVLVLVLLIAGYRSYGDSVMDWFRGPEPARDIIITHSEFRADLGGELPVWFIALRNTSGTTSYSHIILEATYFDSQGAITETDRIQIDQVLAPGQLHELGSTDARPRGDAVSGTLEVVDAEAGS